MKDFKYRSDIDGLRAIAVIAVIVFHFNPKWLPSGFLGVDVFFVLSGYLITSIIYREMVNNKFSFKDFYIRRMKRILPLFFIVIFSGLLLSWYIFMPQDVVDVANSAIDSTIFLANRYFAKNGGGISI
ncbi:MAG: acyltransferase [Flavobacteriaceae bacterium]|nr:acyltransferase [Flavobacteriaceae bacterium]